MNKKIREMTKDEIKKEMLLFDVVKNKRKNSWYKQYFEEDGEIISVNDFCLSKALNEDLGSAFRLYMASLGRNKRLKKKVIEILKFYDFALFITMTFNDVELGATNQDTRRRLIARYLKLNCYAYIANIDFGSKNKREHYHALVLPKNGKLKLEEYRKMFHQSNIQIEHIRINNKATSEKVSKYINKLTNHSLKENGFYKRLIYSRNNFFNA